MVDGAETAGVTLDRHVVGRVGKTMAALSSPMRVAKSAWSSALPHKTRCGRAPTDHLFASGGTRRKLWYGFCVLLVLIGRFTECFDLRSISPISKPVSSRLKSDQIL